ncbi:hypothetical protein M409DRAFT_60451 [Zasmidium cellare ATCC 36951]|uniref:Peptidase S8/S53 domain-containing protein n=1 Tax=Zasmidium cellare ATCC 36951 TaxID=1080233 RepID=A0A6A6BYI0_ZASCE|nr:uncharacterized protein M409DRAFT_60451 [Zasmidium cellare ATCC 36951]KAF2159857.1 hypothetical protein M409DRAFT_60451 [Zasmidium cellare ATCC 36951]
MLLSTFAVLLSPALLWVTDVAASPAPKAAPLPQYGYPTDPCALKGYDQKCCTVLDGYGIESKHLCDGDENCCGQGCCPESWSCNKGKCERPESSTTLNVPPCYGCSSTTSSSTNEVTDTTYTFTGPSTTNGTTAPPPTSSESTASSSTTLSSTEESSGPSTGSSTTTVPSSPGETSSSSSTGSSGGSETQTSSTGTGSTPPSSSTSETLLPTNSDGQTIITRSGDTFTIPTGLSTPVVITSGSQTLTFTPSPSQSNDNPGSSTTSDVSTTSSTTNLPSTNSNGQTVVTSSGNTFTIPTGITAPTVITSGDQTFTFTPSSSSGDSSLPPQPPPSTNSNGQTIITSSGATFTIPTGISTPTTITSNDQTLTFIPSPSTTSSTEGTLSGTTFVNSNSQTVISNTDGVVTLPTGITTPLTTTAGDQTFTFIPSGFSSFPSSTSSPTSGTTDTTAPPPSVSATTNSDGETIISDTSGVFTIPTGISTPVTLTNSDGQITTFTPGPITSPPSSTTSSSSTAAGFIIPITTPVDQPQPTDDGTIIPCTLWFFNICLRWDDFNIFGWQIVLPPGIRPPGPPPPISIDPSASFRIEITGTLPDWPELTIGPDHLPTYTPTSSPTSCETQTAELCATRTSYGVSNSGGVTVTTTSQVLSTCATIAGCNAQDASTIETTTGGCTSATTATNIWLSCPGTASTSCSTTSTAVTSGCSVTPTTVTCGLLTPTGVIDDPACSAPTGTYVIYPENGADTSSVGAINTQLQTYVDDPSEIYTSNAEDLGVLFWRLDITETQANEMREFAGVASVNLFLPCDQQCDDPTSAIVYQNAVEQLQFVSWPESRGIDIGALNGRYYFDESNGEGIRVYIVDTGVNRNHPELTRASSRIRFLHVGRDLDLQPGDSQPQDDSQTDAAGTNPFGGAHGTTMLSLVAGDTVGVAKSADLIAVRMPRRAPLGGGFTAEDFLEGLEQVSRDLEDSSSTTRAVVLLAHHYLLERFIRREPGGAPVQPVTYDYQGWEGNLIRLLNNLISKGALIVTGSGNNGNQVIEGWPARLGKPSYPGYISSLLVAGALSTNGQEWWDRTNNELAEGLPNICAPGLDVKAADGNEAHWSTYDPVRSWSEDELDYKQSRGTSDAAAMTAGLGAYFLQLAELGQLFNDDLTPVDTSPDGLKTFMINSAWSRIARYSRGTGDDTGIVCPGIWNTANLAQNICPWNPNPPAALLARQEGDTCEIPLPSSSSSSSSTASSTTEPPSTTPPLPTLTGTTGISTPSGSSCSVTTTSEQCNGSGGQSVCIDITTCASWVASSTSRPPPSTTSTSSEPPATPTTPLEIGDWGCWDEADFEDHPDIDPDAQEDYIDQVFRTTVDLGLLLGPGDDDWHTEITSNIFTGQGYYYGVRWIEGCVTSVDEQNVQYPLGDDGVYCKEIWRRCYTQCTGNGGVGGWVNVGCLQYWFEPTY